MLLLLKLCTKHRTLILLRLFKDSSICIIYPSSPSTKSNTCSLLAQIPHILYVQWNRFTWDQGRPSSCSYAPWLGFTKTYHAPWRSPCYLRLIRARNWPKSLNILHLLHSTLCRALSSGKKKWIGKLMYFLISARKLPHIPSKTCMHWLALKARQ